MEGLAQSVLKMYMEMDNGLYDKCCRENNEKTKARDTEREVAAAKWQALIVEAQKAGFDISTLN